MLYVVGYSTIDVRESLLEVILRGLILIETGDVLRFDEAIPCQEKKVKDEFPISLALFPASSSSNACGGIGMCGAAN